MMKTIDDVIEQCEEIANASKQHTLHMTHFSQSYDEWAEEWTQIAEWLKELKAYKEQSGDAISRQAVEKITWEEPTFTDALNVLAEVRDKVRALPSVTPQQRTGRWIPVWERAPEKKGTYLVTQKATFTDYVYINVISYALNLHDVDEYDFADKKRPGWYEYDIEWGYRELDDVIAWMPLPEPYKAESEDKE